MPAILIDVGHIMIAPNQAGQPIEIPINSTDSKDPQIGAMELKAQIASDGPVFQSLDFSTNVWNTFAFTASGGPWATDKHLASGEVAFADGLEAIAKGTVVNLVVDSTGLHSGSYELRLAGTRLGGTKVFGADGKELSAVVTNGTIQVLSSWQNLQRPGDPNGDGLHTPIDALLIINALNKRGSGPLPDPTPGNKPPPYYDANGDGKLSPADALVVINCLNGVRCHTAPMAIAAKPGEDPNDSAGVVPPKSSDEKTPEDPSAEPDESTKDAPEDPSGPFANPVDENDKSDPDLRKFVFASTPLEELVDLGLS